MERDLEALYLAEFPEGQKAMAASRQVIEYTMKFVRDHECKTLLDAGSGLSSFFFHSCLQDCDVRSCDDDPHWGRLTEKICKKLSNGLLDFSVHGWWNMNFDMVFFDYGSIESRIFNFKKAMSAAKYMVIDDMHVSYYRDYVQQVCVGKELRFLPETVDEYGRYAALLVL